jgi:hypothetical protein
MAPGKTNLPTDWNVDRELFPPLSHYYGDVARQIMLGAVALMMFAAPFYSDSLSVQFPFEVASGLCIVAFAALTNPVNKGILLVDTLLNGALAAIFGMWALSGYGTANLLAFVLRDCLAIFFIFAFYFSLKTLRAMLLHQIGKPTQESPPAKPADAQESERYDPLSYEEKVVEGYVRKERGD